MFFVVVGTHTEHVINEFALDARINILICQCHTVTNGTDLRRSPPLFLGVLQLVTKQNIQLSEISKKLSSKFKVATFPGETASSSVL